MTGETHWHYRKCPKCGRNILSKAQDGYNAPCPKCDKMRVIHTKSARFGYSDADSLFVESDPLPFYEGGFRKGVPITRVQADCMCTAGTFSDGTILVDKNCKRFIVKRRKNGGQTLIALDSTVKE